MTTLTWVVGSGGLPGSQVARVANSAPGLAPWTPAGGPLPWEDRARLEARLAAASQDFVATAAGPHEAWSVFWCAGAGVVGTSAAALHAESSTWEFFLARLGAALLAWPTARDRPGHLLLASSAGGVYAGSPDPPLDEGSPTRPISPYGREKLRQERALEDWAGRHPRVSVLVGRLSNLYGPGQKLDKPRDSSLTCPAA